jgi:hypothetical protein
MLSAILIQFQKWSKKLSIVFRSTSIPHRLKSTLNFLRLTFTIKFVNPSILSFPDSLKYSEMIPLCFSWTKNKIDHVPITLPVKKFQRKYRYRILVLVQYVSSNLSMKKWNLNSTVCSIHKMRRTRLGHLNNTDLELPYLTEEFVDRTRGIKKKFYSSQLRSVGRTWVYL